MEARIATATALVGRLEGEAKARGIGSGWRQSSLELLLDLPLAALRSVEQRAFSVDSLSAAAAEAGADPQLLGDPDADLVYTPITPCRFIDTRFYAAGKINGVRPFDADATGASYGSVASCDPTALLGVPAADDIGAIAMNVTIFDTSTAGIPGFAAAKPNAAAPTTSLLNWYDAGAQVQVANQGIVTLDQTGGVDPEFVIQTSGAVHVIVDIFGAFIEPEATALQTSAPFTTIAIAASGSTNVTSPSCPAGYSVTGGGCTTTAFTVHNVASLQQGSAWTCSYQNTTAVAQTITSQVQCARVPGR